MIVLLRTWINCVSCILSLLWFIACFSSLPLLLGQKVCPLRFMATNEIISACIAALSLINVCIAKPPICLHVLVHVWPQLPPVGVLVEASLPAASVEHMHGTTRAIRGMAHSWFDWLWP